jgi:ABC-type branched-subunit amino acid transport system substrate-binding protein
MTQLAQRGRLLALAVGAAACAAVVSSCSSGSSGVASTSSAATSSGSSAPAGAGSASGGSAATGSAVKIMVIATRNNPGVAQPELFEAAQAETDAVNASGGVNGHKLVLLQCDENLNPNLEKACVDEAVSDKVSAVVGSAMLFDQLGPLASAHIPLLYNVGLTPALYADPISYPTAGIVGWFAGEAMMAARDRVKTVEFGEVNQASSADACAIAKTVLANEGIKVLGAVTSNLVSTDRTADAAALMLGNPGGILLCGNDIYNVPMIKALRQAGYEGYIYSEGSGVLPAEAESLGSLGNGVRIANDSWPPSDISTPIVAEMVSSIDNYAPGTELDETSAVGWSGVYLFAHAMAKATSFTGQDVINALNAVKTPIQGGVFGPFVGSGTPPFSQYPRLFNVSFLPAELENGKLVATGGFITVPTNLLKPVANP